LDRDNDELDFGEEVEQGGKLGVDEDVGVEAGAHREEGREDAGDDSLEVDLEGGEGGDEDVNVDVGVGGGGSGDLR